MVWYLRQVMFVKDFSYIPSVVEIILLGEYINSVDIYRYLWSCENLLMDTNERVVYASIIHFKHIL